MEKQQEAMLRQQHHMEKQNIENMMEMMKLQESNETKVKCLKWKKEENVKNFLNRLQSWNHIEGKHHQPFEALNSGRSKEKQIIE